VKPEPPLPLHERHESWAAADCKEWRAVVQSTIPVVLIFAVGIFTAWPLTTVKLDRHDHPTHLLKAWQFFSEMLVHGRLSGFNHYWSFGYPVNDITPCGGEMWVALFRLLTFARLSWEATYKLALAGLIVFIGLAGYEFSRRYFGRVTATLAALIAMLDPGANFQGGWEWCANIGVWPITLGCCCVSMAFAKLDDAFSSSKRRHVIAAGLWMTAALWAHQLSMLLLALALPVLFLEYWTRGSQGSSRSRLRLLLIYAIGFGLASFFLLPLLARSNLTFDRGGLGDAPEKWARKFLDLNLFDGSGSILSALCIIGALRSLAVPRRGTLFLSLCCGVCLLLATDITFNVLHLERVAPGLVKLESGRMIMGCKLFGYPLAAYAATSLFQSARRDPRPAMSARYLTRWLVAMCIMYPFIAPASSLFYKSYIAKSFGTEFPTDVTNDFMQFNHWAHAKHQEASDFYRIADATDSLDLLQTKAPMLNDTPMYLADATSAQQFRLFPQAFDTNLFEALSVKYVVADRTLSDPVYELVRTFGNLRVYGFKNYRKDRFTILGPGQGELLTFEPDLIRLRVSGTSGESRLKLHVAHYDRWQASQDGAVLPISLATVYGNEYPVLMEVPVHNGVLEFRYVRRAIDWIGFALTALAGLITLLYAAGYRRLRLPLLATALVARHPTLLKWVAAASMAALALVAVQRHGTKKHLLPSKSIFHRAEELHLSVAGKSCATQAALTFSCPDHSLEAAYTLGSWGPHLCMATNERRPLKISLLTELGADLQVYTDTKSDNGSVKVSVDQQVLGEVSTRHPDSDWRVLQFDTHRFTKREAVRLELEIAGAALRCFDVRIVPP
jgi:hypothetical protein